METLKEQVYQSDLTDAAWRIIFSFFSGTEKRAGETGPAGT
jgi:hypothetical protein